MVSSYDWAQLRNQKPMSVRSARSGGRDRAVLRRASSPHALSSFGGEKPVPDRGARFMLMAGTVGLGLGRAACLMQLAPPPPRVTTWQAHMHICFMLDVSDGACRWRQVLPLRAPRPEVAGCHRFPQARAPLSWRPVGSSKAVRYPSRAGRWLPSGGPARGATASRATDWGP